MERRNDNKMGCGPMTLALPVLVLMIACGISEVGNWTEDATDDFVQGVIDPMRTACCVTAVEYPGGYDWQNGKVGSNPRCSLVVFADGVPAMKFPAGDGYEISTDPDLHRMSDGHLYTFFSKNGATVVKKDGKPLYRYNGDEILEDMLIRDGDIYTLAGRASGGFSYRKNGQPLVERYSGDLLGKMWEDGDSVCFAFTHSVAVTDGLELRYYVSVDAEVSQVEFDKEAQKVWDLRSRKGKPVSLVSSLRWNGLTVCTEEYSRRILLPINAEILSCAMFDAGSQIGSECVYSYPDGSFESGLWVEGAEYIRFETGRSISAVLYSDGKACCVLNPDDDEGIIFDGTDLYDMPAGYYCAGGQALAMSDGHLYVALSSRQGDKPVVWHADKADTLNMNGYLCSVYFTGTTSPR